jgi:FkbM family methyltransferase
MFTIERAGYSWVVGDHNADDGLGPSDHEENLEPVFRELLGPGGVFLDIGAHAGHWTVRLAGQAAKVIAVEAHPGTAEILRQNIAVNGLANVTVVEAAAWDSGELLRLEDPKGRVRSGTNRTVPDSAGTVRGQPLDGLLAGEPVITLVKMDVEGADLHVLRGMAGTLARCRPAMIVERHDFLGYYTRAELDATLASLGYSWRDGPLWAGAPHLICEPR